MYEEGKRVLEETTEVGGLTLGLEVVDVVGCDDKVPRLWGIRFAELKKLARKQYLLFTYRYEVSSDPCSDLGHTYHPQAEI